MSMEDVFKENEILAGTYQVFSEIGRGGVGVIYLARHLRLNKYVVIKRIRSSRRSEQFLRDEADIMKNLHHPGLPQVYDYIVEKDSVYTVIDYIDGADLSNLHGSREQITEKQAITWLLQMAEVLEYLHTRSHPIIHSDIKPQNIILRREGSLCLIDFNVSLSDNQWTTLKGVSEEYGSPEQVYIADAVKAGYASPMIIDTRTDIYSLGATFYSLLTGLHPSGRKINTPIRDMEGLGFSRPFTDIIDKAMEWNRDDRYASASEMIAAIKNLKKSDSDYKKIIALRTASFLISGLLVGIGCLFTIRGVQANTYDEYLGAYQILCQEVEYGDYRGARAMVVELLNDTRYANVYMSKPEEKAKLENILGDIYAADKMYGFAIEYYRKAINDCSGYSAELATYYRNLVKTYIDSDKLEEARVTVRAAMEKGITDSNLELMLLTIERKTGDASSCAEMAKTLIENCQNREIKAAAAKEAALAAINSGDEIECVRWLETALTFVEDASTLRETSERYLAIEKNNLNSTENWKAAKEHYDVLKERYWFSYNDYINYSQVLIEVKDPGKAITVLNECEKEYGISYPICYRRSVAYFALNNDKATLENALKAKSLYESMPENEKNKYAGEIESLEAIIREVG